METADRTVSAIIKLLAAQTNHARESILLSNSLADLGMDSLDRLEVTIFLEQDFGIDIDDDVAARWTTVGDVVSYIQNK